MVYALASRFSDGVLVFKWVLPDEKSGRIENLSLEMSFVEIDPFGASFVHVNDFGMIKTEKAEDGGVQVVDVNSCLSPHAGRVRRFRR